MTGEARDAGPGGAERPRRWGALYAAVLAALAVEIALLAWLTRWFR